MTTFSSIVRKYEKLCDNKDIPCETVMAYLTELSQRERYDLYLHYEDEMPEALEKEFEAGMDRILHYEPMEDVLIPRPETEELCANILARMDEWFVDNQSIACADVGTGSGAIAIVLAKEEPKVHMMATDISEEAVVTARKNAENNEADIEFVTGDMLQPLIEKGIKLDVLVSNPPYIPQEEVMEKSVVDFEPHVALFGGEDGLKFYREIFKNCKKVLKEKAFMAFEMGWDQRERMSKLVEEMLPDCKYEILKDMNGKDRMLFVYLK